MSEDTEVSRSKIDWEQVENLYRAGVLSLRSIGKECGVSESMIRKKAQAEGWERDLSAKVNARVRNELVRSSVRSETQEQRLRTDKEVVEDAAATKVSVVRGHQARLVRLWNVADALELGLLDVCVNRQEIAEAVEAGEAGDVMMLRVRRALSIAENVTVFRDLSGTIKTLVALERQAFNIKDDDEDGKESYEDRLARLAVAVAE